MQIISLAMGIGLMGMCLHNGMVNTYFEVIAMTVAFFGAAFLGTACAEKEKKSKASWEEIARYALSNATAAGIGALTTGIVVLIMRLGG